MKRRRIAACSTVLLFGLSSMAAAWTRAASGALEARITAEVTTAGAAAAASFDEATRAGQRGNMAIVGARISIGA